MRATVLTSATLTVDGAFDYVRTRLGIAQADELRLASEFDYASQASSTCPADARPPVARVRLAAAVRSWNC